MTVVGAALVPAAPVLIQGMGGRRDPAQAPRAAALTAIRRLLSLAPAELIVMAEGAADESFDSSAALGLHRFGGMAAAGSSGHDRSALLPAPLAIGAALLQECGWSGPTTFTCLPADEPADDTALRGTRLDESSTRCGLLLLGSGSARSTARAPGSLHAGADAFNSELLDAIQTGGGPARIDPERATEQMSDVRTPLAVLAGAASHATFSVDVTFAEEFSGVFYVCASWTRAASDRNAAASEPGP